jgi:hypothetical protein
MEWRRLRVYRTEVWEMPESASEYEVRMLRFKMHHLEHQLGSALSDLGGRLAKLEAQIAALDEPAAPVKPSRRARANSKPVEPGFDGI